MKNFIACLILTSSLLTATGAWAEDVVLSSAESLTFKTENGQEVVYDKNGELYSGAVALADDENRRIIYFYSNGRKNGVARSNFSADKIEFQTTYVNGKKNGDEVLFYNNGKLKYKRTYQNDLLNGEEIFYYPDGKPQKVSRYTDGKLNGVIDYFDENGDRIRTETYKNGIKDGPERIIANNILREEIQFANGKREGIYKTYSSEGSWREIPFKNDKKEGEGKIYSPQRVLIESVIYANDKRNGLYKRFSLTGRLISAENYKDDRKDGVSRYFDNKGKLTSVSYFMDGVELGTVQIAKRNDIQYIQDAIFDRRLNRYSNKKNLWYKILWLGLNLDSPEILEVLEKEMKMYAVDISDTRIYQRWSGSQFEGENKTLFFGLTPLDYAINIESPIEILQKFAGQAEDKNSRGMTALRDAVRLNKTEMVKFLLLNQADLKDIDEEGNNILLYSVITESPNELIKEILSRDSNVNTKNKVEQTPLSVAVAQKNAELIKLLIAAGANTQSMPNGQNLLHYAYDKKVPLEVIAELLDSGIDINSADEEGNNLLLKALKHHDEDTAMFALEHNADINQKDSEGETAVSYVLFNEVSPKIVEKIFSMDFDYVNKLGKQDKIMWKVLMEQNKLDLLKKTWDKMPDVATIADANGEIPVREALKTAANPKLHELALSYIKNADDTMVWDALKENDYSLFRDIFNKAENVNTRNENGESILIYAVKNNYDKNFFELMLDKGVEIDAVDNNQTTALKAALEQGKIETAEYLLKAGAKPEFEEYITNATPAQDKSVRLLLKFAPNISLNLPNGESTLMKAVKKLNLPLFEHLSNLENVDWNITDSDGNNLLLSTAEYFAFVKDTDDKKTLQDNFMAIVKALLNKGADINSRNGNGETLLIRIAKSGGSYYDELAKFLIENGADTSLKDQYNQTAEDYRPKTEVNVDEAKE